MVTTVVTIFILKVRYGAGNGAGGLGFSGPGGPVTNAIHTHHYFHYHRLHCPLCIKLIIPSIFHIILTHLAALL